MTVRRIQRYACAKPLAKNGRPRFNWAGAQGNPLRARKLTKQDLASKELDCVGPKQKEIAVSCSCSQIATLAVANLSLVEACTSGDRIHVVLKFL